ncbi:MAG: hypothetical protein JXQ66_01545 [Campylobacterales bacterium]|nr:hypothetical protein [Campylobacterales bacterium]
MLNDEEYEIVKDSLIESRRLFEKLNNVADQYNELEHDESGYSLEDEETLQRHWKKLSSKIIDSLAQSLEGYSIELYNNEILSDRELLFNLVKENEITKISVDYSQRDSLNISQIS